MTLYHWDLPESLHGKGGWLSKELRNNTLSKSSKDLIIEAFGLYARTCYEHFGDRVKHWITLNEHLHCLTWR